MRDSDRESASKQAKDDSRGQSPRGTDNVKRVRGIDSEIIDLTTDIETFNARLGEAFKNPRANDHHVLRVIVKKFRFVVDEAKDTIANYVVLNKRHGDHVILKSWDRIPLCGKVSAYASDIESIRAKMKAIRQEHEKELLYLMQFEIKGQDNNVKTLQVVDRWGELARENIY
nr:putative late blight resistance protein homolog R1B-8 [Ipomoea batatas]